MAKTAKLIYSEQTEHDTKDTASSLGCIIVPMAWAAKIAGAIDAGGESAVEAAIALGATRPFTTGHKAAAGFGVIVQYDNGRTRTVRAGEK